MYSHCTLLYVQLLYVTSRTVTVRYCMYSNCTLLYVTVCTVTVRYCMYSYCTLLYVQLLYVTVCTVTVRYCMYSYCTSLNPQSIFCNYASSNYFLSWSGIYCGTYSTRNYIVVLTVQGTILWYLQVQDKEQYSGPRNGNLCRLKSLVTWRPLDW
jgi:hypothetical protein